MLKYNSITARKYYKQNKNVVAIYDNTYIKVFDGENVYHGIKVYKSINHDNNYMVVYGETYTLEHDCFIYCMFNNMTLQNVIDRYFQFESPNNVLNMFNIHALI